MSTDDTLFMLHKNVSIRKTYYRTSSLIFLVHHWKNIKQNPYQLIIVDPDQRSVSLAKPVFIIADYYSFVIRCHAI